jgi:hypothetical protein
MGKLKERKEGIREWKSAKGIQKGEKVCFLV